MKNMKKLLLMIFLSLSIKNIQAEICPLPTDLKVPFQKDISIKPNGRIFVNYSFDHHPIIFCYTNSTTTAGRISWTYNHVLRGGNLPIFLKTNSLYEGEFADPTGCIGIGNNTSTTITVNCIYGF